MEEKSSKKMFMNSILIWYFPTKNTPCPTFQEFSIRNARIWGKLQIKIRGYFRRGKTTDNYLKLFVKIDFLNEDGTVEEIKSKEQIEKEKKKKKNKKNEPEVEKDDVITKSLKTMDIFNKNYLEFLTYLYYNKKEKKNVRQ